MPKKKLTTASGRPYTEFENSMTAGNRGSILLQDYLLHEDMAHFNCERIPERAVHAKGAGAFGTFTVTHDITKVWPHAAFPLIEVGTMELNRIPENYFLDIEQSGFAPAHVVDGIEVDESYKELAIQLDAEANGAIIADWFDRNENDDDHYTQPGKLFRLALNEQDRKNLVLNIVDSMKGITGNKKNEITNRQIGHFSQVDKQLGQSIAEGLAFTYQKHEHNINASYTSYQT